MKRKALSRRRIKKKAKRASNKLSRSLKGNEVSREFIWEGGDRIATVGGRKSLWVAKNWGLHTREQMESLFNDVEGGGSSTTNGMLFATNFDTANRYDLDQKYYEKMFTQTYTIKNNEPAALNVKIYFLKPKKAMLDIAANVMDTTLSTTASITDQSAPTGYATDILRSIHAGYMDRYQQPLSRYGGTTNDQFTLLPTVGGSPDVVFINDPDTTSNTRNGLSLPVGISVFDSPYFKQQWEVIKCRKVSLPGGKSEQFSIGYHGKSFRFKDHYQSITQAATPVVSGRYHTKHQIYVMFEIQGTLGHDASATEAFDLTYATTTDYTGTGLTTDIVGFLYGALDVHVLSKMVTYVDEIVLQRPQRIPYLGVGNSANLTGSNVANSISFTATEGFEQNFGGVKETAGLDNTTDATNPQG